MSTKKNNNTQASFNQVAQQQYNSLQPQIQKSLLNDINDPLSAIGYPQQLAQQNVSSANQSSASTYAASMGARGIDPSSGIFGRGLQNQGNAFRSTQAANNTNLLLTAGNLSQSAATAATQYQPQQTGQNQGTVTGGVGSLV